MQILNLHSEAFGIDISDLSLKIIKLKKKRQGFGLSCFGTTKIKPGIVEQGEIKDKQALISLLKQALSQVQGEKIKTKYVVCSLPEEKAFSEIIQLPKMNSEEAKKAAFFKAENYIPLSIEKVYLDSQVIHPLVNSLDHLDVLITAFPKNIINDYVFVLKKANLIPKVLEIECSAIARATIKDNVSPKPLLLIDFGAVKTRFIIFSGTVTRFTSATAISSELFTKSIAKNLNIKLEEAEKLKRRYGLSAFEKIKLFAKKENSIKFQREISSEKKIFDALIPPFIDLTEQIQAYLDYYITHISHEHLPAQPKGIKEILISGGGANLKGLVEFLREKLNISVKLANPWINILPPPLKGLPELPFKESLKYTTALGLALRGVREN